MYLLKRYKADWCVLMRKTCKIHCFVEKLQNDNIQSYAILKISFYSLNKMEKAMATHSSTLAWKIPWAEEHGRLQSMGSWKESDTTEQLHFHFSLSCIGEGNGNPLQCSCLETPRDGGTWWAAVYGVEQSWTRLKRLSSTSSLNKMGEYIVYCCIY